MRAIVVDDQELSLEIFQVQLSALNYFNEIEYFQDSKKALDYVKKYTVDVAFLDITMDPIDGLTLASAIKTIIPSCYIIFETASESHALDAFRVHASGYLLKPVRKQDIKELLDSIFIHQKTLNLHTKKRLRVKCFGNFAVFDSLGRPLSFRYSKSKELLAYLIHQRGAVCTNAEIAAILYEDREDSPALKSQIRNLISDITKTLQDIDASTVLFKKRGGISIIPNEIECDYYEYIHSGDTDTYQGEYMNQYEWAEVVNAYLNNKLS